MDILLNANNSTSELATDSVDTMLVTRDSFSITELGVSANSDLIIDDREIELANDETLTELSRRGSAVEQILNNSESESEPENRINSFNDDRIINPREDFQLPGFFLPTEDILEPEPEIILNPCGHGQNQPIVGTMQADRSLNGTAQNDTISGLAGGDEILGLDCDDILNGGDGGDDIYGGDGNDELFGNQGFDRLFGGVGNDTLTGADVGELNAQDNLTGNSGKDTFVLGTDNDALYINDGNQGFATIVDFQPGTDLIQLNYLVGNYSLNVVGFGAATSTEIFLDQPQSQPELIGIVSNVQGLQFNSDFIFV